MTKRPKLTSSYVLSFALSLIGLACAQVGKDNPTGTGTGKGGTSGSTTGAGGSSATGSGGRQNTTTGAGGDFSADGGEQCGLQFFDIDRRPADILLLLDRSASMKSNLMDNDPAAGEPTKWSQIIPALTDVLAAAGTEISWGYKSFPEGDVDSNACKPVTVTNRINVQIAPANYAAVSAAVNAETPEGDGTPTAAALNVVTDYLKMVNDGNRKYILLATDGQPSCPAALTGENTAQARTDAVAAVTAAHTAGFPTFVLGVSTKPTDADTLNMMAAAGGVGRADPNPLAMKFYFAGMRAELVTELSKIVGVASTCVFPLSKAPPVPDKIAVKVNGTKAPQDTGHTNGWDYVSADNTSLEVYGSWCDMIKSVGANKVEVIFGCKDIPIP